jgi:hypothetical protein
MEKIWHKKYTDPTGIEVEFGVSSEGAMYMVKDDLIRILAYLADANDRLAERVIALETLTHRLD